MDTQREVERILREARFEEGDPFRAEAIEALIPEHGWREVLEVLLRILRENSLDHCRTAAEVIWGAVLDEREMPADRVIAHLYFRWSGPEEDNLVWSITAKLKHVDYLSDYNALADAGVLEELEALR